MSSLKRRVLMTRWMGDAVEAYNGNEQYKHGLFRMFEKTGALMTADDFNDSAIVPDGTNRSYNFERLDAREEANPDEEASVDREDTEKKTPPPSVTRATTRTTTPLTFRRARLGWRAAPRRRMQHRSSSRSR